jgi:hypothetical protein
VGKEEIAHSSVARKLTMNRFFWWLAVAFLALSPPWYGYQICQDLRANDWTANGWERNPAIYGPILLVVAVTGIVLAFHIYLSERKARERATNRR